MHLVDLTAQVNISVGGTILGQSLVGNSGFESGMLIGLISFGPTNLSISSSQFFTGNNSLLVDRSSVLTPESWHGIRFTYQDPSNVNLEVGATYQFSSKVYLTM